MRSYILSYLQILELAGKLLERLVELNDREKPEVFWQWFIRTIEFGLFCDPPQSILWWICKNLGKGVGFGVKILKAV